MSRALAIRRASGRPIRAGYDAARTGGDNAEHWTRADGLGPIAANDPWTRQRLRDRTRYEVANNPTMAGVTEIVANDTVGLGPRLQVTTEDETWNDAVEAAWDAWSAAVGGVSLALMLNLARRSEIDSGEVLYRFRQSDNVPERLDLELMEADRLTRPLALDPLDGIELGQDGRPIRYHVLKQHPGDAWLAGQTLIEAEWVPASQIIHSFKRSRPGQQRGIPELAPSLELLAEIRRYQAAVLAACEVQASIPLALESEFGPALDDDDAPTDEGAPWDEVAFDRRLATVLPAGYKLNGINPTQPVMQHNEYVASLLVLACRPLKVPWNIVLGDSSNYSYASGRLDMQDYDRARKVDRKRLEATVLDRIFATWLLFAIRYGVVPYPIFDTTHVPHSWMWQSRPHVEPLKEANANAANLKNNTTTLAEIWAEKGEDWKQKVKQRAKERAFLASQGLPTDADAAPEPANADTADTADDAADGQPSRARRSGRTASRRG